jgi:hypothetical protein
VLLCASFLSIGGAICAGRAMGLVRTDMLRARRMVSWSWGWLAIGFVAWIGLIVLFVVVGVSLDNTGSY